jgi:membrane fusion protein, protease secretion system
MDIIDVKSKPVAKLAASTVDAKDQGATASLPTNTRRPLVVGLLVLLLGFGGFLLWAAFAPLDEGAPAMGNVTLDSRRKTLQHFSGGVLKEIRVKEGDSVKEGDIVIRLDDSLALASKSLSESQLRATQIQIQHLDKMIAEITPMVQEGFYPRNRLMELQRDRAEAEAQIAGHRDRLAAAKLELERAIVRAPATGRVMGIEITTVGGVIGPGGKLMDIVPDDEELVIEAQIEPHLVEKVYPGLEAEVRFSALNLRKTPIIVGKVEWVSPDKFVDPNDPYRPMGYFTSRVVVSKEELAKIGDTQIRPGMPADVIIKTGERTFLEYLVKPLTDRMATSLKEQ